MSVFYTLVSFDGGLLKKFLTLSKGMYKHLLFYLFDLLEQIDHGFMQTYGQFFEVQSSYLSQ